MSQDEEIRRLRREVAQLREERDILGKATASSPRVRDEIRVHPSPRYRACDRHHVSRVLRC